MIPVTLITVGTLKEQYLRDVAAEYVKRLRGFCRPDIVCLREARLPDAPADAEIRAALADEGKRIIAAMPPRAYRIALCVEGKMLSSPELAAVLENAAVKAGALCLVIGSSHGIAPEVKDVCDLRLSLSPLTFPHQLTQVLLLEILYRSFQIQRGTKYHK